MLYLASLTYRTSYLVIYHVLYWVSELIANDSLIWFDFILFSILFYYWGFTCYFFFMSAYLWLSVLCYDIWMNFKETNVEYNAHKNIKPFIMYSLYVWLSAGFATWILVIIQNSKNIDEIYKPDIGIEWCWLNSKYMVFIFFRTIYQQILILSNYIWNQNKRDLMFCSYGQSLVAY